MSFVSPVDDEVEVWVTSWRAVFARGKSVTFQVPVYIWNETDLIDSRVVSVDAETSVEEACEVGVSLMSDYRTTYLIYERFS